MQSVKWNGGVVFYGLQHRSLAVPSVAPVL
jgi:hypothetical protein